MTSLLYIEAVDGQALAMTVHIQVQVSIEMKDVSAQSPEHYTSDKVELLIDRVSYRKPARGVDFKHFPATSARRLRQRYHVLMERQMLTQADFLGRNYRDLRFARLFLRPNLNVWSSYRCEVEVYV